MALTHGLVSRQLSANTLLAQLDGGGYIEWQVSQGGTVACTTAFSATAFGSADGSGIATANSISDGTISGTPTIAWFQSKTSAGVVVYEGDVKNDGTGVANLDKLTYVDGETLQVNAHTYTAMP